MKLKQLRSSKNKSSLPRYVIEKDLQSVLKPFNAMEALFFCAKYRIRDNIITTNHYLYSILSVFVTSILSCYRYYQFFGFSSIFDFEGFQLWPRSHLVFIYFLFVTGSFSSCCTNIFLESKNILFVIKIQDVYRVFHDTGSFKHFVVPNWIYVITINVYQIVWILYSYYVFDFVVNNFNLSSYFWIVHDIHLLYAATTLKLMTTLLKAWIKHVQKLGCVENAEHERCWNTMYQAYVNILDASKIFETTFHHMVSNYFFRM